MHGRFPILYIAEADAEEAVLSSGTLAHLVEAIPHATFTVDSAVELAVIERSGFVESRHLGSADSRLPAPAELALRIPDA